MTYGVITAFLPAYVLKSKTFVAVGNKGLFVFCKRKLFRKGEKNGFIRRDPTKPRAIEICDDNFQMVRTEMASLPVIGTVAAGTPILAEENIDSYFPVPADIVPNGEPSFVLKVKGDSMINVGIFNGDQIFVQQCNTAKNGDTVVALIDDSATVKTFYKEKDHIRLQPENDDMDPIIVDDCQILGKVFGVFRYYKH